MWILNSVGICLFDRPFHPCLLSEVCSTFIKTQDNVTCLYQLVTILAFMGCGRGKKSGALLQEDRLRQPSALQCA